MGRVKSTAATKLRGKGKANEAEMKTSIRALGGDADADWDMVKDVESDVEEAQPEHDPALVKDVAKFMKGLKGSDAPTAHTDKTAAPAPAPAPRTPQTKYIVPPSSHWHTTIPPLTPRPSLPALSPAYLASQSTRAATLLAQDAATYTAASAHTASAADARFLTRVLAGGTLSDRLSALTLMVQGAPLHNTRALETLRGMAAKKGRGESLKALRAVVDWWVGGGAPPRKLRYFRDQPLTHPDVTEQHLVLWSFEDWLKKYFFSILQLLEGLAVDPLPYVRTQATALIFTLLRDTPEQEHNLLRLLAHKLGDTDKAVASKASHALLQLLQPHPHMKTVLVHEVANLIFKPPAPAPSSSFAKEKAAPSPAPTPSHARYYAVVTFNQIVLRPGDKAVAARLIDVYFSLFREILGEGPGEGEGAGDVAGGEGEERDFTPKKRRGYKGAQKGGKGKKKRTGADAFEEVPDSSAKLVAQILTGINRALPFAKSAESPEFTTHINTLFRITHTSTFPTALQALMLLHHATQSHPALSSRFYRALYASLLDPRLATAAPRHAMYLNLLFRAVKKDADVGRVAAFVRRFVQVLAQGGAGVAFVCGGLFLLGELFAVGEEVRAMTSVAPHDAEEEGEKEAYDPRKRDPQHAHALASPLWELLPLTQHFHPAVALHARQLLAHARVTATADLGLNTLAHFLDRFVYRNARKKGAGARGGSAMQPGAQVGGGGVRAGRVVGEVGEGEGVDQVFFQKFFKEKGEREVARRGKAARRKGAKGEEDGAEGGDDTESAEEGSDAEEAEIWKAMKASVPELGGSDVDGDEDSVESIDNDDDGLSDDDDDAGLDDNDGNTSLGSAADFLEDPDDLLSDTADPPGLLEYASGSEDEDEDDDAWHGFEAPQQPKQKQKRARDEDKADGEGRRRKKRVRLPTFASYEEYAGVIERGEEEEGE